MKYEAVYLGFCEGKSGGRDWRLIIRSGHGRDPGWSPSRRKNGQFPGSRFVFDLLKVAERTERTEWAEWADLKMMTMQLTYVALAGYIEVCKRQRAQKEQRWIMCNLIAVMRTKKPRMPTPNSSANDHEHQGAGKKSETS